MAFVELTRILPRDKRVKWSVNPNNVIYFQEPVEEDPQVGCTLVSAAGTDVEINVMESYQDVKAKLAIF